MLLSARPPKRRLNASTMMDLPAPGFPGEYVKAGRQLHVQLLDCSEVGDTKKSEHRNVPKPRLILGISLGRCTTLCDSTARVRSPQLRGAMSKTTSCPGHPPELSGRR